MRSGYAGVKRLIDVLLSASALILLLPLIAAIAVLVRVNMGAPVLFRQQRPGLNGIPFEIIKFRTMTSADDSLPDTQRITAFGKWLRSTSLDELPELWNVLVGEMSFVGPRPLFMEYLELYSPQQARRHDVLPGITGWAQVNGRNSITWDKKFELDVWYVDNCSFALDCKIMILTVGAVLRRSGINSKDSDTVERFKG